MLNPDGKKKRISVSWLEAAVSTGAVIAILTPNPLPPDAVSTGAVMVILRPGSLAPLM